MGVVAALGATAFLCAPGTAAAAPGDLDPSFGSGGLARVEAPSTSDVAVDGSGRTYVLLSSADATLRVAALDAAGALDPGFGIAEVTLPDFPTGRQIAIDSNGRVLVLATGSGGSVVVRFGSDGSLDAGFGQGGAATIPGEEMQALAADASGAAVVAGDLLEEFRLRRLTPEGQPDPGFGIGGLATLAGPPFAGDEAYGIWIRELVVSPAGDYLVGGAVNYPRVDEGRALVARFDSQGAPDVSFGDPGFPGVADAGVGWLDGLVALPGGGAVALGKQPHRRSFHVVALAPDGSQVPAFAGDGRAEVTIPGGDESDDATSPDDLLLQADGKLVVAGDAVGGGAGDISEFVLARLLPNGEPDAGFGQGGAALVGIGEAVGASSAALSPDGRPVVAGAASGALVARFLGGERSGGVAGEVASGGHGIRVHRLISPRSRAKLAASGVRALASCRLDCRIVLEVRVSGRVAKAMGLKGTLIARGSRRAEAGERRWVIAKLRRGARRGLSAYRGGGSLKVSLRGVAP